MEKPITYEDLRNLVLQHGIAPKANIAISAHFRKTLYYSYGDLTKLGELIRQRFQVSLTKAQISSLGTIQDTITLLDDLKPGGRMSWYPASVFGLEGNE